MLLICHLRSAADLLLHVLFVFTEMKQLSRRFRSMQQLTAAFSRHRNTHCTSIHCLLWCFQVFGDLINNTITSLKPLHGVISKSVMLFVHQHHLNRRLLNMQPEGQKWPDKGCNLAPVDGFPQCQNGNEVISYPNF